jgi:RNA polymerase sigma factor (TIGR02999 family)
MSEVTRILSAIEHGDSNAAEQLLPLVYDELRKLAAQKLAHEMPGQTLQATALVHEAYLRMVASPGRESGGQSQNWDSGGHFFAAAAEAMRRILVENARRKGRLKRGGAIHRQDLPVDAIVAPAPADELLAVHEALDQLESAKQQAADLVKLRYFAGFTIPEAAEKLGISPRKANQVWTYARAWLLAHISDKSSG